MKSKFRTSNIFTKAASAIATVLALFISGCSMDISNPVYTWSLGSDKASFKVTSAVVNGKERLSGNYSYNEPAYSTNLDGYLSYTFSPDKLFSATFTIEDYKAYGTDTNDTTAYNQWVAFLTADTGEQWILRPDHYSNETIGELSEIYYEGNDGEENSTYTAGTYGNNKLWNGKLTIKMEWNPLTKVASVHASKTSDPKVYYYATASKEPVTKRVTLGSEAAKFTVKSAVLSTGGEELELIKADTKQEGLAYWAFGGYTTTSITGGDAFDITYKLTDYTAGTEVYNNWMTFIYDSDENATWVLRSDNWSNTTFSAGAEYSGTTNTFETPGMFNCEGDVYVTVRVSFNGESTYTVKAWKSDSEDVFYQATVTK